MHEDNKFSHCDRTLLWISDHILHEGLFSLFSLSSSYGRRNRKEISAIRFLTKGLFIVSFLENANKFENPFHHPIIITVFFIGITVALWLDIGVILSIDEFLTLGYFQIDSTVKYYDVGIHERYTLK